MRIQVFPATGVQVSVVEAGVYRSTQTGIKYDKNFDAWV